MIIFHLVPLMRQKFCDEKQYMIHHIVNDYIIMGILPLTWFGSLFHPVALWPAFHDTSKWSMASLDILSPHFSQLKACIFLKSVCGARTKNGSKWGLRTQVENCYTEVAVIRQIVRHSYKALSELQFGGIFGETGTCKCRKLDPLAHKAPSSPVSYDESVRILNLNWWSPVMAKNTNIDFVLYTTFAEE